MRLYRLPILAALALVLCVHDAGAQFGGFPGNDGMHGGTRGAARGERTGRGGVAMPQRPATPDAIDDELGQLEQALNLTPGQWKAWQPYVDRVRALAADVDRERRRAPLAEKQSAVQQIDRGADVLRNRLTALEDIATAARKLYDTLTPEQKETADGRLSDMVLRLAGAPRAAAAERPAR